jgi:hypothetical protein
MKLTDRAIGMHSRAKGKKGRAMVKTGHAMYNAYGAMALASVAMSNHVCAMNNTSSAKDNSDSANANIYKAITNSSRAKAISFPAIIENIRAMSFTPLTTTNKTLDMASGQVKKAIMKGIFSYLKLDFNRGIISSNIISR